MGKTGSHRGFAGISGLVSDLSNLEDGLPSSHPKAESEGNQGRVERTLGKAPSSDSSNRQSDETSPVPAGQLNKSKTRSESPQKKSTSTNQADKATSKPKSSPPPRDQNKPGGGGKWFLVIAGAIFLIWAINQSDRLSNTSRSTPSSSYSPPPSIPSSSQPSGRITYPSIDYQMPEVGRDSVLSVAEIRWCTKEGIRIEAMRNVSDTQRGIDRFNQIVNDYNSRCGSYRYRSGNKSRAERDVEPYRVQIAAAAIQEIVEYDNPSYSAKPSTPHTVIPSYVIKPTTPVKSNGSKKPSKELTREAQQLLTDLGYNPGPIDGDYGRRTATAVKAFQRDAGIAQDSWIDHDLLIALRRAAAAHKPTVLSPSSQRKSSAQSIPSTSFLGTTAKPKNLSFEEQSRYDTAQRLRRLGYDVDWRTSSLMDMLDAESRIGAANRLSQLGYKVDWKTSSLLDMLDAESRIGAANRLSRLGHKVDWKTSSLMGMLDAESRIGAANRLKRKGVSVDWQNYTLMQLLSME